MITAKHQTLPGPVATIGGTLRVAPALIVIAAVTFNAVLAAVNGNVMALSPAHVILAEIMLVAAALVCALAYYRPEMTPWFALMGILVLIALYRSILLGQIEVKYLRDVLLIPIFVLLGMTFDRRNLVRLVVAVHLIVLIFLVFEAVNTDAYSTLFKVQDYYINTRGYEIADFWNKESDLYVSASRPDERTFAMINLHRLSSIFLEPVSLGNYCIVITAFICTYFRQMGWLARIFLITGNVVAIVGCDGRLAAAASIIIMLATVVVKRLPRYSTVVYLPGITLAAFIMVALGGFHVGGDDFPGRIAKTVDLLSRFGDVEFLGLSDQFISEAVDSGIAYLIMTQTILGLFILWAFIVFASSEDSVEQLRFTHAVCIYLSLSLMVSFAVLTIKTAALLWFVHGALQAAGPRHEGVSRGASRAAQLTRLRGLYTRAPLTTVYSPHVERTRNS